MADRFLYTVAIPERDQSTIGNDQQRRISAQTSLTTDFGNVQDTGTQPGQQPIVGAFKGLYADLMAKQLQELAQGTGYTTVAYYTDDNDPKNDAYVTVDSFTVDPANPRNADIELWEFDGSVTEAGTRRSHWRTVETQPTNIDNPFGAGGNDRIGIPATATKVRWYDQKGQSLESASATNTIAGRFEDHEIYNPDDPSFSNPTLIYKVPYSDEGKIDARVWDDFGRSQLDGDDVNSWQKVFISGHNYNGSAVVENGLLRMTLDEDGESLTFSEWDTGTSSYSSVSLGASDWVLTDVNFTRISPSRVGGQMRFRDTNSGSFHTLDFQVNRASNRVLFITPTNQGSIPSGLDTKLDPIAEDWGDEAQPIRDIISRREVND